MADIDAIRLCETCLPSFAGEIRQLVERAEKAEALADELAEALLIIVNEVGSRYDDQWAVGGVLLADLDDARAALAKWKASRGK